jgi:hypothetical protein
VKQATVDLTTTCLTYLCLDIFDPEIEENYLDEQILSGGYRLHTFAASQWVALLRSCARMLRDQPPPDELISLLEHFVTERENMGYTNPSENIAEDPDFKSLKQRSPQLHAMLCHASKFRQLDVGEWRLDEGASNFLLSKYIWAR